MTFTDQQLIVIVKQFRETIALLRQIADAAETELENHEKRIRKLEGLK